MQRETHYLMFADMVQPVLLRDCGELLPRLPLVFPGWPVDTLAESESHPVLELSRDGDEYRLQGHWLNEHLVRHEPVDALCALVAEVMRAYVRQDDQQLCLHAAAVELGGRLVVFPSQYRAGKSILSACCAAAGTRLFCDDILPLGLPRGDGIAPGLAPRLRLPLPDNLDQQSRQFITERTSLSGKRYAYLDLGDGLTARGEHLPIGAFVLLERQAGARTELAPIDEADVLAQVVWQNFAREAQAPLILEVLSRVTTQAGRFRLRYDRAEDAVALLQQQFADWPDAPPVTPTAQSIPHQPAAEAAALPPGHYRQHSGIKMVETGDQFFLADDAGAAIHRLNPTGSAIWELMTEPVTLDDIVAILSAAFPELDPVQLHGDVGGLLHELLQKNLLQYGGD